jgi:Transposase
MRIRHGGAAPKGSRLLDEKDSATMFIGWDWASTTHDITVLDERGTVVDRWALPHTEQALTRTLDRLAGHGDPAELPVIIERPDGLVVDRLLAAGHPVFPVHPTAFHAARPRWGASGAKSDPGDSYNSPTTCAPTATACAGSHPPTAAWANCRA